jgi:hypothetical protein
MLLPRPLASSQRRRKLISRHACPSDMLTGCKATCSQPLAVVDRLAHLPPGQIADGRLAIVVKEQLGAENLVYRL